MPVVVSLGVSRGSSECLRERTDLVLTDERAYRGHEPLILDLLCLHLPPRWRI
jgi:septum formation topological specificity factor MinE